MTKFFDRDEADLSSAAFSHLAPPGGRGSPKLPNLGTPVSGVGPADRPEVDIAALLRAAGASPADVGPSAPTVYQVRTVGGGRCIVTAAYYAQVDGHHVFMLDGNPVRVLASDQIESISAG